MARLILASYLSSATCFPWPIRRARESHWGLSYWRSSHKWRCCTCPWNGTYPKALDGFLIIYLFFLDIYVWTFQWIPFLTSLVVKSNLFASNDYLFLDWELENIYHSCIWTICSTLWFVFIPLELFIPWSYFFARFE